MKTTTDELGIRMFSWVSEERQSLVYAILTAILSLTTILILLLSIYGDLRTLLVPVVLLMVMWMLSFSLIVEATIKNIASRLGIINRIRHVFGIYEERKKG